MKKISSAISALIVVVTVATGNAAGRPITVADLLSMPRISEPQLSPDATRAVYTLAVPDVKANRMSRDVWMVTLATSEARALTTGGHEGRGRWSPDGKSIAFISTRSGNMQLYVMNADGSGSPKQLTNISSDLDGIVWAPDGRSIAKVHIRSRSRPTARRSASPPSLILSRRRAPTATCLRSS